MRCSVKRLRHRPHPKRKDGPHMNKDLELLTRVIDEKSAKILNANDKIWEYAELAFHETRSAALLKSILKEEGFTLTEGDAGIPTCFTGTFSLRNRKTGHGNSRRVRCTLILKPESSRSAQRTSDGRRSRPWMRSLRTRNRCARSSDRCERIPDRK